MNISNIANVLVASALNPTKVSIPDVLLISLIGILLVFAVLFVLELIIELMGFIMVKSPLYAAKHPEFANKIASIKSKLHFWGKKKAAEEEAATDAEQAAALADGTCGELVLVKTEERDAAMIMAIVADALETPLNELRFKSIKRIEEGETK